MMNRKTRRCVARSVFQERLTVLFLFLMLGMLAGQCGFALFGPSEKEELQSYLTGYAQLHIQKGEESLWPTLWVYVRYPLAAFLLGFTVSGRLILPGLCFVQGFLLSFSVACFASALAQPGVVLALAALGVRCLVTLPCVFLLSVWAWETSQARASGLERRGSGRDGSLYVLRFIVCLLFLLLGTVLERTAVPRLVALALAGVS